MFINLVVSATQKFSVHNRVAQNPATGSIWRATASSKSSYFSFEVSIMSGVPNLKFAVPPVPGFLPSLMSMCQYTCVKHFYGARQILNAFGGRTNDEITHVAVGKLSGCFNVRTILEQRMINCTRDIRLFVLDLVRFLLRFRGSRSRL